MRPGRQLCLALCLLSPLAVAQPAPAPIPPPAPDAATADHASEAFVIESSTMTIAFQNDGTGTRELATRIRIQSEAGVRRFGLLTFPYQDASESLDIDVRVSHPDGSVVATPEDGIQDMPSDVTRQAPFYSDIREKHVAVKGLAAGDTLDFRIRWTSTHPTVPGQFWFEFDFDRDEIVLRQELRVTMPKDRPVKWKSRTAQPTIAEDGPRRTFTWIASNPQVTPLDQDPKRQDEIAYRMVRGRLSSPEIQLSSFQSWEEVGRWYDALQRERIAPTPEIRSKAAELTKGAATEEEKIRAIYRYVATQYRYIGIAFGIGRYQPHAAAEVLANRYGDCKDKHTLLASLLEAVGIKAAPALIHSMRDIDPDVPSPAGVNHVITAVTRGGELLWLDTTPEVAPFGYLLQQLRDKQALLVARDGTPRLVSTPKDAPSKLSTKFQARGKLQDNGTLEGRIEQTVQAQDREVLLRSAFRTVPMTDWKSLVQQISYASGFAGDVSDVTASSPEKTDEPFRFSYGYKREGFPNWSERTVADALPPLALPALPDGRDLTQPVWLGDPGEFALDSAIEVPKGYAPTLPAAVTLKESFAEYACSRSFKDGVLTTSRRIVVTAREVPVDQQAAYRKFRESVASDQGVLVPFSSGTVSLDAYQSEIWRLPDSTNPAAAQAYGDARGVYRDPQAVIAKLKRAVEIDPGFTRAWLWLGEMYSFGAGNDAAALRAYRKGIDSAPSQVVGYRALGSALRRLGKQDEALAVWRDLVRVAPDDAAGHVGLADTLAGMGRHAEAASELEAALAILPAHPQIQRRLGSVYLHAGDLDKAMAAFEKAIEVDPRPDMFNDIAYDLAEANKKLPEALEYARRAVLEEEQASKDVSFGELKAEDLKHTQRLDAYWDTLGWVHLRMGSLEPAEDYLNAAWNLSPSPVAALHLGQVLEARGKKDAALQTYQLGVAAAATSRTEKAFGKDLNERIERLGGKVATTAGRPDGGEALGLMRTFDLPGLNAKDATADMFLLVGPSGVVEMRLAHVSDALKIPAKMVMPKDLKQVFPQGSDARLVRRGFVSCSKAGRCNLVLVPPDLVNSVE